jgi:hypothetical protein
MRSSRANALGDTIHAQVDHFLFADYPPGISHHLR